MDNQQVIFKPHGTIIWLVEILVPPINTSQIDSMDSNSIRNKKQQEFTITL